MSKPLVDRPRVRVHIDQAKRCLEEVQVISNSLTELIGNLQENLNAKAPDQISAHDAVQDFEYLRAWAHNMGTNLSEAYSSFDNAQTMSN